MERKQTAAALFLLVLAAIALYISYMIVRPFLSPIFLAVMLAIVFHPIHMRIQGRIRNRNTAAVCSTILAMLAFVVPAVGLAVDATTTTLIAFHHS